MLLLIGIFCAGLVIGGSIGVLTACLFVCRQFEALEGHPDAIELARQSFKPQPHPKPSIDCVPRLFIPQPERNLNEAEQIEFRHLTERIAADLLTHPEP